MDARALVAFPLLLALGDPCPAQVWPTAEGWPVSSAQEQGLDPAPLEGFSSRVLAGDFGYVDRFVVVSRGSLVVDRRIERDYEAVARGETRPIGFGPEGEPVPGIQPGYNYLDPGTHPYFQGRDVHTLQSVTKSIGATLIAIAIARGEIEGVEVSLLPFLEDHDLSAVDERLHEATLEDLLTMRTGIEWHEVDRPLGPTNSCYQAERSADWIQFTLDLPMDAAPGEKWAYNSGGSQLMSGVLRKATGRLADDYAREHLFEPLGIEDFHWKRTPAGFPDLLGGLYLATDDLARIGYLYLNDGVWEGERLLPEGWVAAATARQVEDVMGGMGYGYQWWRADREGVVVWAGLGFGGQYLFVLPERELVGALNSWQVFGTPAAPALDGFLAALIEASAE